MNYVWKESWPQPIKRAVRGAIIMTGCLLVVRYSKSLEILENPKKLERLSGCLHTITRLFVFTRKTTLVFQQLRVCYLVTVVATVYICFVWVL